MQVILLERVEKLGQMGDEVRVKDGFARNFLLPKKKALRANKTNREFFLGQKAQLEARNLTLKKEAEGVAGKLPRVALTGRTGLGKGAAASRPSTPSGVVRPKPLP